MLLHIRACKSGGIDSRVHGISIIGRVDMNEDEVAANFCFMTVENASKDEGFMRQQRKKEHEGMDAHSNKVRWTPSEEQGHLAC